MLALFSFGSLQMLTLISKSLKTVMLLFKGNYQDLAEYHVTVREIWGLVLLALCVILLLHVFESWSIDYLIWNYEEETPFFAENSFRQRFPYSQLLSVLNCLAISKIFIGMQSQKSYGNIVAMPLLSMLLMLIILDALIFYSLSLWEITSPATSEAQIIQFQFPSAALLLAHLFFIFRIYRFLGSIPETRGLRQQFVFLYFLPNYIIAGF